jgi:hypothetical protein
MCTPLTIISNLLDGSCSSEVEIRYHCKLPKRRPLCLQHLCNCRSLIVFRPSTASESSTGIMASRFNQSAVQLILAFFTIGSLAPALAQHSHSHPAPPTPPTNTISAKPSHTPGMPMDMPMDMPMGMGGASHTHSHSHPTRPQPPTPTGPLYVQGGFPNSTTCTNPKIRKEWYGQSLTGGAANRVQAENDQR